MPSLAHDEPTIRQILQRAEDLYEQFGTPLVGAPHRRAWAFARAFGATRLAREFGVARATVVTARRLAFARWHYWMTRYEEPVWQQLADVAGDHHRWEACVVRYRSVRATLRQEHFPRESSDLQSDALVACAVRSLASVPWRNYDTVCWQSVWRLLARRSVRQARQLADQLGWSAVQWRRARGAVPRLGALIWLPVSQRQLLALRAWPAAHLAALQQTGQALFPTRSIRLLELVRLAPISIAHVARTHDHVPVARESHAPHSAQPTCGPTVRSTGATNRLPADGGRR
ncbi:MAG: hypothetical protein HOP18_19440 [Deltaproteobacteria bacterium]|nr:hypothetical protein [Deltaproteobacteria bacterium]